MKYLPGSWGKFPLPFLKVYTSVQGYFNWLCVHHWRMEFSFMRQINASRIPFVQCVYKIRKSYVNECDLSREFHKMHINIFGSYELCQEHTPDNSRGKLCGQGSGVPKSLPCFPVRSSFQGKGQYSSSTQLILARLGYHERNEGPWSIMKNLQLFVVINRNNQDLNLRFPVA